MTADEALKKNRVAVCGGPRVGKTTLANGANRADVVHTDDFIEVMRGVDDRGSLLAGALAGTETFVLEGVWAAHALRSGLRVDAAIWLDEPHVELSRGQQIMSKGVRTVFDEWMLNDGGQTAVLFL